MAKKVTGGLGAALTTLFTTVAAPILVNVVVEDLKAQRLAADPGTRVVPVVNVAPVCRGVERRPVPPRADEPRWNAPRPLTDAR